MTYQFKSYEKKEILRGHLRMGGENLEGERIDVTSLYLERGGRPWLPVMGEYHFSRAHRDEWYRELCKMKAGGITIVATYMFWIYHEETEGEFDFEGDRDIRRFLEDAERAGLDVLLRIGPWAHGECRNGAFPDWLLKKPYPLRDNNPEYMAQARRWYEQIYARVKGKFYKDGGCIIGIQIENELVDRADHLLALKQLAVEIGFDVPIYTVTGWNSKYGAKIPVDDTLPVFAAYVDAPWADHIERLPPSPHYSFLTMRNDSAVGADIIGEKSSDGWQLPYERYPYATCELGAGLQPTHHRRMLISGMDAYALSLVKLGCGNNLVGYYMYHGGTNKIGKLSTLQESKATGYPNDYPILNYDFHTALTQYGEAREQYGMLNILHLFLHDFGSLLATMEHVEAQRVVLQDDLKSLRYCMRRNETGGFVFINHYQRMEQLEEIKGAVIDTGTVCFPPIDVKGEICFFMPFDMMLGKNLLRYATAQPLCRVENTYFFVEIAGITPCFQFEDGTCIEVTGHEKNGQDLPGAVQIEQSEEEKGFWYHEIRVVLLTFEEAKYARKLAEKLYIGENCNVYEYDGQIRAVEEGDFSYRIWTGQRFEQVKTGHSFRPAKIVLTDVEEPFVPPYEEELNLGCKRSRKWQKIDVDGGQGFVEIPYIGDAAQIYADGELVADEFFTGEPWRVPAGLLFGRECYLVFSQQKDDFYRER